MATVHEDALLCDERTYVQASRRRSSINGMHLDPPTSFNKLLLAADGP